MAASFVLSVKWEGAKWLGYLPKARPQWYKKTELTLDDFDANVKWTPKELDEFASLMIREDFKNNPNFRHPVVLLDEHLTKRYAREIYNTNGFPEPSFGAGLYWRTHPQGRKMNSEEQRKLNGASFYR